MKNIQCTNCSQEISKKASACPKCGHPNKKANHLSGGQALLGIGIGVTALFWLASLASGPANQNTSRQPSPKSVAMSNIELNNLKWSKGGFDSVMEVSVTLVNKGTHNVKDIELTCQHFSNSGTRIDRNKRTVYEILSAGQSKSIKGFNMGFIHSQVARTNCSVTDLVLM